MNLARVFLGFLLIVGLTGAAPFGGQLVVDDMTPAPGSILVAGPATILLPLSTALDPATVTPSTVRLVRAGGDGTFGTGDDVSIAPFSVQVIGGNQIQIDLAGAVLPDDQYSVLLSGTVVAPPAPIGHWALDEAAGPGAADSSGSGNDGIHVTSPTVIVGKTGNGLSLDGIDQIVEIADADLLSPHVGPAGDMSVSAWVRLAALPSGARGPIVGKAFDGHWEYVLFVHDDGSVSFSLYQNSGAVYAEARAGSITLGDWHHLAGTMKKGMSVKVFIDGIQVDNSVTFAGDTTNGDAPLRIGQSGPTPQEFLNGDVDDVRLFNSELTPGQVRDLATLGGAVRDTTHNVLDGEFSGAFPSGNGAAGGNFTALFGINVVPGTTPSTGGHHSGGCGGTGLELLLALALRRGWRRLRPA